MDRKQIDGNTEQIETKLKVEGNKYSKLDGYGKCGELEKRGKYDLYDRCDKVNKGGEGQK